MKIKNVNSKYCCCGIFIIISRQKKKYTMFNTFIWMYYDSELHNYCWAWLHELKYLIQSLEYYTFLNDENFKQKVFKQKKFTAFVFIANISIIITFACYRCIVFLACTMAYCITILCHRFFLSQSFVLLKSLCRWYAILNISVFLLHYQTRVI